MIVNTEPDGLGEPVFGRAFRAAFAVRVYNGSRLGTDYEGIEETGVDLDFDVPPVETAGSAIPSEPIGSTPAPAPSSSLLPAYPYGYCQTESFEVILESPLDLADVGWAELSITITPEDIDAPAIELVGDAGFLAVAIVHINELSPGKWLLIIDREEAPYPLGPHEMLVDVTVGDDGCQAPLLIDVYEYQPES